MKKIFIFAINLLLFAGVASAQDEQKEINAIKSNLDFLYATGTSTVSSEDAATCAGDLLALEIEEWLKEYCIEDIAGYVAKSRANLSQIHTQRGKLYRVFAYVKKNDVLPLYEEEKVMVVSIVNSNSERNDSSVQKSPAVVTVDQDALHHEAMNQTVQTPSMEEASTTSATIRTEATENAIQDKAEEVTAEYIPTALEREMLKIHSFNELNDYINDGREAGSIYQVGKYANLPQTGTVYVFIHNRQGEIPACMKVTDGNAFNLGMGKEDVIRNYKGCGAIWIEFKE